MSPDPPSPYDELLALMQPERWLDHPHATGHGVRVAIVDSGIDRAKLEARAAERQHAITFGGGAIFSAKGEPQPWTGSSSGAHGSTVADIVHTVAPDVELYSADVFGPAGSAEAEAVSRAVLHALDVWNCRVINLSLGIAESRLVPLPRRVQFLRAMEEAYERGAIVVAAAHNDHPFTRSLPAVIAPPLVSVDKGPFAGSREWAYRPSGGVEFQACSRGYTGPFSREPATSWAAPHITGIVARLLSLAPDLRPFEVKALLRWLGVRSEK